MGKLPNADLLNQGRSGDDSDDDQTSHDIREVSDVDETEAVCSRMWNG